ncbi:MAG TPA: tRNA preQ1(34) S-adenosylmethionine ribosyltransferase-isomerase QueA [Thermoanaerobaculia bacterium]|nr:tRNA preQ1(34) S-adenosylmethionine ribosyltransferase-isomerase QueA [Thermoanaerobaculia bacterium]
MLVADFDFDLPEEAIAQRPSPRGTSRLMTLGRTSGAIGHRSVADLPDLLSAGDVLVVNETRVLPARLFGTDAEGRRTEILLASRRPDAEAETWECLAKPGRRARPGRVFDVGAGVTARVLEKTSEGRYVVAFEGRPLAEALETIGSAPLPPYIHRPGGVADARDATDYQTVYARDPGAIAAPTAGLHFTDAILRAVRDKGVEIHAVTLHVGLGTFKPVKVDVVEEHRMDVERGTIPISTADAVNRALDDGRRVVAVGTTTVRALESSARLGSGRVVAGPFATDLFLTPGTTFAVVSALLTNFHLPRSTLLMLVSAFAGRENVLRAYREAVGVGYRFFSYGDAMLIA